VLGRLRRPRPTSRTSRSRSAAIAALGPYDVGQGMVIGGRRIVAVEGAEGTDGMLDRCATMLSRRAAEMAAGQRHARQGTQARPGPAHRHAGHWPGNGRRRPPRPVSRASPSSPGSTLVVEVQEVIRLADAHGLFVVGRFEAGEAP
jgi:DUF1009 family protein